MKHLVPLALSITLAATAHAQLQQACIHVASGSVNAGQAGAVQTPDGGFVIAGRREPTNTGYYHIGVTKLDANGVLQWMKYFVGGSGIDWPMVVINTSDGGLAVAGVSDNMGTRGMFILKLDALGNEQWTKAYTGPYSLVMEGSGFIQLADGGYALVGSPGFGFDSWHFLRTDAAGDVLWSDRMDFDPNIPTDLAEMPNGDLVYTGWNSNDLFVMRKDGTTGATEWMNWYATDAGPYEDPYAIVVGPDSTIVIAGIITAIPLATYDAFAFALEADGTPGWFTRISGPEVERANDIAVHPDGGYVLCGFVNSAANTSNYLGSFAARLDDDGQLMWSTLITSPYIFAERLERCAVTADGGMLLADRNTQLLVKLDANGNTCPYCPAANGGTQVDLVASQLPDQATSVFGPWATSATLTFTATDVTASAAYSVCGTTGVDELEGSVIATVAPNPFSRSAVLTFDPSRITGDAWIELRDVLGRVVQRQRVVGQGNTIDRGNLPEGSYAWFVTDVSGILASGKVEVVND